MKKIIVLLFILGTAYPLLNCMEKEEEPIEESTQKPKPTMNAEYRKLKEELDEMTNNSEDYVARFMQDYSLSKEAAEKEIQEAIWKLYRKTYDAYFKAKNK